MNEQIKAGSDIHAGDSGYSIGTKEKYDEFVKIRNKSLAKSRIRELAVEAGASINTGTHPLTGVVDGLTMRNKEIEKFAELIVQDCANFVRETYDHEAAESIAWGMEIKYGLHGDYA